MLEHGQFELKRLALQLNGDVNDGVHSRLKCAAAYTSVTILISRQKRNLS